MLEFDPDTGDDHPALESARARVLALHARAGDARLRTLREIVFQESETCDRRHEFHQGYGDGIDWSLDQIDATLEGGE